MSATEKRFVWTNDMFTELLNMRFSGDVESADTSMKKRLAWQYLASRLSEKLSIVLTGIQVATKYKKLKCEYRQGTAARNETGNEGREDVSEMWGILNCAFARRTDIGGAVLADIDDDSKYADDETTFNSSSKKAKPATPLETFTDAMKKGMTAIVSSMGSDDKLATALQELKAFQDVTQELQTKQNTLLELLINNSDKGLRSAFMFKNRKSKQILLACIFSFN
ncbi:hypothetical protein V7S43_002534 [Phytophthora oleae]|uniref:Myb/SANT-like domain-containing protein n=1 Tax=Phytophthora oleae TaxID=2107226 RepID=A0ABD3FZZ7_9STRA